MAAIVGVHGIAQQLKGPDIALKRLVPALRDGVRAAGGQLKSITAVT